MMTTMSARLLTGVALALAISSCAFKDQADAKFGDQNFKSAIALIELHKLRYGSYPETLKDLKFTGEWDAIYTNGVSYQRLEHGYRLDVTRGWIGEPKLTFPAEFWQNLGVVESNVKRSS